MIRSPVQVSLKRESNFKHTHVHAEQDRVMRIGDVVGLSSGDVDSCGDDPQYKLMKYLVFETISTSLLRRICTRYAHMPAHEHW